MATTTAAPLLQALVPCVVTAAASFVPMAFLATHPLVMSYVFAYTLTAVRPAAAAAVVLTKAPRWAAALLLSAFVLASITFFPATRLAAGFKGWSAGLAVLSVCPIVMAAKQRLQPEWVVSQLTSHAAEGDSEGVRAWLKAGADCNSLHNGEPALAYAIASGSERCVGLLMQAGADVLWRKASGQSLLHLACTAGSAPSVRMLLEAGALPDQPSGSGDTPLHRCAQGGHVAAAKVLLEYGVDVNHLSRKAMVPPLYWALINGHDDMVIFLRDAGADPGLVTRYGDLLTLATPPMRRELRWHEQRWPLMAHYFEPRSVFYHLPIEIVKLIVEYIM